MGTVPDTPGWPSWEKIQERILSESFGILCT
jgi:hypothetical protein